MALSRYRRDAEHFEVVTPFSWNERHFSEGEAFPAHELGLGEMERRQLWVANKIRCVDAPPAATDDRDTAVDAPRSRRRRAGA